LGRCGQIAHFPSPESALISTSSAETVGFEVYFRDHLGRFRDASLTFQRMKCHKIKPEGTRLARAVGKPWANARDRGQPFGPGPAMSAVISSRAAQLSMETTAAGRRSITILPRAGGLCIVHLASIDPTGTVENANTSNGPKTEGTEHADRRQMREKAMAFAIYPGR
jgi:hypothetical protein